MDPSVCIKFRSQFFFYFFRLLSGFSPIRGLRAVIRETSSHQLLEVNGTLHFVMSAFEHLNRLLFMVVSV